MATSLSSIGDCKGAWLSEQISIRFHYQLKDKNQQQKRLENCEGSGNMISSLIGRAINRVKQPEIFF